VNSDIVKGLQELGLQLLLGEQEMVQNFYGNVWRILECGYVSEGMFVN
jgi:hypothetical protein